MDRSHVTIRAAASEVSEQEGIQSNEASEGFGYVVHAHHQYTAILDMLKKKK